MDGRITMATVMGVLGAALLAEAHLVDGSLSVKAGDKVQAGSVVNVKWTIQYTHAPGDFDISVSTNGGTSFQQVEKKKFPLSPGEVTYAWTVPNSASATAQFKICQYEGVNACAYTLTSGNFTIESGSAVRGIEPGAANSLRFNATNRNLEVSFVLEKESRVSIQAFDAKGKLLATLLDGEYEAGSHRLSVFSSGLDASGPLLFQLRTGEQVRTFRN